jgi:hypothetical protein
LRNFWSFNIAFTAAGVGMLIGVLVLVLITGSAWNPRTGPTRAGVRMTSASSRLFLTILLPVVVFGVIGYFAGRRHPLRVNDTIGPITFGFLIGMLPDGHLLLQRLVRGASPEEKARPGSTDSRLRGRRRLLHGAASERWPDHRLRRA